MKIIITENVNTQFGNVVSGKIMENGMQLAEFSLKKFDEGSKYGIAGGRISKLFIKDNQNNILACYDRGWDVKPGIKAKEIFEKILKEYN